MKKLCKFLLVLSAVAAAIGVLYLLWKKFRPELEADFDDDFDDAFGDSGDSDSEFEAETVDD